MPEKHELVCIGTSRSGAEIWQCPDCQHQMEIRWWPSFQAEVVTEGEAVPHSGSMGAGTAMAARLPMRGPAATLTEGERTWLDEVGIDWDGEGPDEDKPAA